MFLKSSWKRFWSGVSGLIGGLRLRLFPGRARREMRGIRRLLRRLGFVESDLFGGGMEERGETLFSCGDGIQLTVGDRWDEQGRISLTMLTRSRKRSPVSDDFLNFTHFADGLREDAGEVCAALRIMVSEALEDECGHAVRKELERMRDMLEEAR